MRDSIAIEPELMVAKGNSVNIETTSPFATVFYKEDEWYVLGQAQLIIKDNILIVQRPDKLMKSKLVVDNKIAVEFHVEEWEETVVRTTVALEDKVIEIVWEK